MTETERTDVCSAAGALYVVSTPIGNLGDMSPRALEVLASADLIAAEDTRTAAMLLQRFGISGKRMIPSHKFNEETAAGKIVSELLGGANAALVTDAGTPCVSDPGYLLVREAVEAGIKVTPVPGCCAAVAAIAVSGFRALSFTFYGFLPRSAGEIRNVFREGEARLTVYYESPNRIRKSLSLLAEELPDAEICLCNDLTKKFERIYRGTPSEVCAELDANPNAEKGEYVLLVQSNGQKAGGEEPLSAEGWIADRMTKEGLSLRDAVASLAGDETCPYAKKQLYDASLRLKRLFGEEEET